MAWIDLRAVSETFGNQTGAAWETRGRTRDLYVIRRVSFCCPQLVPASAFMMCSREEARAATSAAYGVKVKWVSMGDSEDLWPAVERDGSAIEVYARVMM
jgi:hypothetical protein